MPLTARVSKRRANIWRQGCKTKKSYPSQLRGAGASPPRPCGDITLEPSRGWVSARGGSAAAHAARRQYRRPRPERVSDPEHGSFLLRPLSSTNYFQGWKSRKGAIPHSGSPLGSLPCPRAASGAYPVLTSPARPCLYPQATSLPRARRTGPQPRAIPPGPWSEGEIFADLAWAEGPSAQLISLK